MKIGLASDHRGYSLKEYIKKELLNSHYEVIDYGTFSQESTDYPDYAFLLGESVKDRKVDYGVAICGSGIGISIACNKVKGVFCAKVDNIEDVIATRTDNDANIIAFSEKTPEVTAIKWITTFVNTPCSMEEKHIRRRQKIRKYEEEKNEC